MRALCLSIVAEAQYRWKLIKRSCLKVFKNLIQIQSCDSGVAVGCMQFSNPTQYIPQIRPDYFVIPRFCASSFKGQFRQPYLVDGVPAWRVREFSDSYECA